MDNRDLPSGEVSKKISHPVSGKFCALCRPGPHISASIKNNPSFTVLVCFALFTKYSECIIECIMACAEKRKHQKNLLNTKGLWHQSCFLMLDLYFFWFSRFS